MIKIPWFEHVKHVVCMKVLTLVLDSVLISINSLCSGRPNGSCRYKIPPYHSGLQLTLQLSPSPSLSLHACRYSDFSIYGSVAETQQTTTLGNAGSSGVPGIHHCHSVVEYHSQWGCGCTDRTGPSPQHQDWYIQKTKAYIHILTLANERHSL